MKKYLKFWGTRGSCPVSGPEYQRFGGNTSCLEIRYEDTLLIIDAGTGIRPLGAQLLNEKNIDIFLTHMHWDHLLGFPFFDPIFSEGTTITVWAPHGPFRSCKELFEEMFSPEFFPIDLGKMRAQIKFKMLEEKKSVQIGSLHLECHTTSHPGLTYCFKIKTPCQTLSYISDNEINITAQKSFIDFHHGSDIFIHEAQYSRLEYIEKVGWGHSSICEAFSLIKEIRPKKWIVTHHDPKHRDVDLKELEEITAKASLPCPTIWAYDSYELPLI